MKNEVCICLFLQPHLQLTCVCVCVHGICVLVQESVTVIETFKHRMTFYVGYKTCGLYVDKGDSDLLSISEGALN